MCIQILSIGCLSLLLNSQTVIKMVKEDQRVRLEGTVEEIIQVDERNHPFVTEFFDEFGWPKDAEEQEAFWILVQHFPPEDLPFMKSCLETAKEEGVTKRHIAYLEDRILMYQGEEQLYGTQFTIEGNQLKLWPVVDFDNLEARRSEMGLVTMDEYMKIVEDSSGTYQTI